MLAFGNFSENRSIPFGFPTSVWQVLLTGIVSARKSHERQESSEHILKVKFIFTGHNLCWKSFCWRNASVLLKACVYVWVYECVHVCSLGGLVSAAAEIAFVAACIVESSFGLCCGLDWASEQ